VYLGLGMGDFLLASVDPYRGFGRFSTASPDDSLLQGIPFGLVF